MEYVLKTDSLSKNYRHFKALDKLTMNVPEGAIYGLVGRNGAGKTTLIRLICGLQEPSSGSYILYGKKNSERDIIKVRRRMGAVVETPAIYPDMTARDNLKMIYRILGLPSFDGIDDILELVGLSGTGKKKAGHFSFGMRQRLGIGIALAGDPDFLILDEPANGLDPQGIIEIRELILKLNRSYQITVLISSHILDELSRFATHYGFMDKIRIEVNNIKALACVLDDMDIQYEILSDACADIFAEVNISKLVTSLSDKNCEILSVKERNESLEGYYMSLVGGDRDA